MGATPSPFTIKNLREVEDLAVKFGYSGQQEARFPREELGAERTGLSYQRVKPGRRHAFGHRHKEAEEIYVVLSGTGRVRLDDEIHDLRPLDAIRIAPPVTRAFEAEDDGLELLVFSTFHPGDAEMVPDFWKE
jgi:uncharacterized cupin superfamily protein